MKRTKGSRLSKLQKERIAALLAEGNAVAVCKGADEALNILVKYLEGRFEQGDNAEAACKEK